jgi:hypothetical protein
LLRSGGGTSHAREAVLAALERQASLASQDDAGAPNRSSASSASHSPPVRQKDADAAAARAESVRAEKASREAAAAAAAAAEAEARKARLRAAAEPPAPAPSKLTLTELSDEEAAALAPPAVAAEPSVEEQEEADAQGKQAPNAGNGGDAEWGVWTQTLSDAELRVAVPFGTAARDAVVEIKRQHLKVGLKGQPPLLDGASSLSFVPDSVFTCSCRPAVWRGQAGGLFLDAGGQDAHRGHAQQGGGHDLVAALRGGRPLDQHAHG